MSESNRQAADSPSFPDESHRAPDRADGAPSSELLEVEQRGLPYLLYRDDSDAQQVFMLGDVASARIGRGKDADLRIAWDRSI